MHGEGDLGTELEAPGEACRGSETPLECGSSGGVTGGHFPGRETAAAGRARPVVRPETRAGAALGEASTNPAPARRCLRNFAEVETPPDSLAHLIKEQTRNGPPWGRGRGANSSSESRSAMGGARGWGGAWAEPGPPHPHPPPSEQCLRVSAGGRHGH